MFPRSNDKRLAAALLLFLFSAYLLTYSGSLHSSDGQAMFSVAESLVRRGDYDTNQIRWMGLQQGTFGPDGELYCRKGLGTSLLAVPLAWLGLVVPLWGVVQSAMLLSVIITALTGLLVFLYVRRLGYSPHTGLIAGLVFGLATMAWPYSKYLFSEPLSGLSLMAAVYCLLYLDSPERGSPVLKPALLSGCFVGLAIATRFANAVLIPVFLGAMLAYLLREGEITGRTSLRSKAVHALSMTWRELCAFALPLLPWTIVICGYNYLRFANPFTTGYLPQESFSAPWITGILGLLMSPGRGILLYCPVLLALIPALPRFLRRHRLEGIVLLVISLSYVLLYGKWFMWHGGFAWGPRFLVPVLPLVVTMLAPLIETLEGKRMAAFCALAVVSMLVQMVGLSVHFVHHQEALLETGLPLYDPITFFHPRYSQLWGTLGFLRPENLDFAWVRTSPRMAVDALSLAIAVALLGLSAWALVSQLRPSHASQARKLYLFAILPLLVMAGTTVSLARYKDHAHEDYVRMLRFLETSSQPGDVIVQNSPPETVILQNHYKGHLPSYGLFEGEQLLSDDTRALLPRLAASHARFWLIPDSLAPSESSLDGWFLDRGYSPTHQSFGQERLTLYAKR